MLRVRGIGVAVMGEDVNIGAQAFELLFLAHAEAVFFINNH